MKSSSFERRARFRLPFIRFFQAYVPLSLAERLNRLGSARVRLPAGIGRKAVSADGLPPMLVHAGTDEVLRDDAVRIGELASAAGVDVRVEIYPRMWHVWQLFLSLPQARESPDDVGAFLGSHLNPRATE